MIQLLNQHHKKFLTVIFFIVVVTFVWFGQGTSLSKQGGDQFMVLGGKKYGKDAAAEAARIQGMAMGAGVDPNSGNAMMAMYNGQGPFIDLARTMQMAGSRKRADRGNSGAEGLATMVTIRELSKSMGISIPQSAIDKAIEGSPGFQTNGSFDRAKYDEFLKKGGDTKVTEKILFTAARDALSLAQMKKLVGGLIPASDWEVESAYSRQNAITTLQTVLLPRKEHEAIKAEEKDAKEFYDSQKAKAEKERDAAVTSPSSKNVRYVLASLTDRTQDISKQTPEEQEKTRKGWDDADRSLKETLNELYLLIAGSDETAAMPMDAALEKLRTDYKEKMPALELKNFANLHQENLPDELKEERTAVAALTGAVSRKSGSEKTAKGYLVYQVVQENPAALLEFEQIKDKLITKLTKEKVDAALTEKFNTVRNALETALNAKKPWDEALKEAKVTGTQLVINPTKPDPAAPAYAQPAQAAVTELKSNTIAKEAVPSGEDKVLVYLAKREIMDNPKKADELKQMKESQGRNDSPFGGPFMEWFETQRDIVYPVFEATAE